MTLGDVVRVLERCAAEEAGVAAIVRADVFRLNSVPDAKYPVFAWTLQTAEGEPYGDGTDYRFVLFVVERLTQDGSNLTDCMSEADALLGNILRRVAGTGAVGVGAWSETFFRQRFADECAGAWASVTLSAPKGPCAPEFAEGVGGNEVVMY